MTADDLTRDLESRAVGLDPATIAAAVSALVGLIANCRNPAQATAALERPPGTLEKTLLRNAIRREARARGLRTTPRQIEAAVDALTAAHTAAHPVELTALAQDLTKWAAA